MSVAFKSINPKNNKLYRTFEAISNKELETVIDRSYQRFRYKYAQGNTRLNRRFEKLGYLAEILKENKPKYAELMTQEMGKPIGQSEAEIDKCINHCHYYIKQAKDMMEPEELEGLSFGPNPMQGNILV